MSTAVFETRRLFAPASLRKRWLDGQLPDEWFAAYSGFFAEEDLALTRNQRSAHFGEWFAALDFSIHGSEVLIEKYVYKPTTESYKRARQKLGPDNFEFLRAGRVDGYKTLSQPPDLLVIEPTGDYFFAEVKLGRDRLRPSQTAFFKQIVQKTGRRVVVVEVEVLKART